MNTPNNVLLLRTLEENLPKSAIQDDNYEEWARAVRALNDAFRLSFTSTELYCSPAVIKLDYNDQSNILDRVRNYRGFTEDNDPDMTHKFGSIEYEKQRFVWEIIYLDGDGNHESNDPLNLNLTKRYMMVMLEEEWWDNLPESDS